MNNHIPISVADIDAILGHLRRALEAGHTIPCDPRVKVAIRRVRRAVEQTDDDVIEATLPTREHWHPRQSTRSKAYDTPMYRAPRQLLDSILDPRD